MILKNTNELREESVEFKDIIHGFRFTTITENKCTAYIDHKY